MFLFSLPYFSLQAQESIRLQEVKIDGNLRVEEDGIRLHIKAREGNPFDPAVVDQDVKSIYRMGFFDDVKATLSPEGILTYSVKEKPYIREVKITGNSEVSASEIETALGVQPRTVLDRDKVSEGVERVKKEEKKGTRRTEGSDESPAGKALGRRATARGRGALGHSDAPFDSSGRTNG